MPHRRLLLAILLMLLVGCTPPAPTPPPAVEPTAFVVFDGQTEYRYAKDDPAFPELLQAFQAMTAQVNILLRTVYTPARFQEEIAPLPHVRIVYPETVSLTGDDLSIRAQELVFVTVAGEPLLLVRTPEAEDWAVYGIPPEAAQAFRQAVQEITGVSLP